MQPADEYEQALFSQLPSYTLPPVNPPPSPTNTKNIQFPTMSKKQQTQMLYSIKLHETETQNLLDLTCEETNPRTSRSFSQAYYRQFVEDRIVQIGGPVTIQDGYVTSYKLYKIKSRKKSSEEFDTVVDRRYSDFQYLYQKLVDNYGGCLVPSLPEKSVWTSFNMETTDYMKNRRERLQKFIQKILAHKKLRYTEQFLYFLFDPQNNFSQKKGEHYSNITIQDNFYRLTSDAINTGFTLIKQYIPSQYIPQSLEQHKIRHSKQDSQILHYQVIVSGLTDVINQLKVIVENTCVEAEAVDQFNQICEMLGEQQQKQTSKSKIKSDKNKIMNNIANKNSSREVRLYDRHSKQIEIKMQENDKGKYHQLLQSYQNIFQFIQSCKQAISRRSKLSQQLQNLRQQYQQLQIKSRHNPRNINLDILRSKIQQTAKKYQQFTQQLMEELQAQVVAGKDMVAAFVQEIVQARNETYRE